jgi:hypothetical protein
MMVDYVEENANASMTDVHVLTSSQTKPSIPLFSRMIQYMDDHVMGTLVCFSVCLFVTPLSVYYIMFSSLGK